MTDLSVADNLTQARHELDRATLFGGEAELAAWSRKWGGAALVAIEDAPPEADDSYPFGVDTPTAAAVEKAEEAAEKAAAHLGEIRAAITAPTLDLSALSRHHADAADAIRTVQDALADA